MIFEFAFIAALALVPTLAQTPTNSPSLPTDSQWIATEISRLSSAIDQLRKFQNQSSLTDSQKKEFYNNYLRGPTTPSSTPAEAPSKDCKKAVGFYESILKSECMPGYSEKHRLFKRDSIQQSVQDLAKQVGHVTVLEKEFLLIMC
jgi:hypothetical protein